VSFLVVAALAVGALVLAPLVAHLLRRGRTPERLFPPVALVSRLEAHSKERSRLEDRSLLSLRMAMVVVLALLGATPLVQCSRLSVDRPHGASVALALVMDDSHSMRALEPGGEARWERAREGARQLLRSVRDGDAVALVLAGKPARLALSATTDLGAARAALEELRQTDRSSDLDNAIKLARSAIKSLEQPDKKLIVLSDLAGSTLDDPGVAAPLEDELRQPVDDCGLIGARRQEDRLSVTLACSRTASMPRGLRLVANGPPESILTDPNGMARAWYDPRPGIQTLSFGLTPGAGEFALELIPGDANVANDRVSVSQASAQLDVAVITDENNASVITGGPTVIEQALRAVRPEVIVRPIGMLPDDARDLGKFAALVLNDPPGLGPESRNALSDWIEHGGVALGMLGPASSGLQLSSTLEPFAERGARWESNEQPLDVDPQSLPWLGQEASSLKGLTRDGRMRLDGAGLPGSVTAATWQDGVPFLLRRTLGAGLVLTAGLPAAVEHSDLALRPGFLALLDYIVGEAEQRRGPGASLVGEPWTFPASAKVTIQGPDGPLAVRTEGCDESLVAGDCAPGQQVATPELAGVYTVTSAGNVQTRVARLDEHEITDPPGTALARGQAAVAGADSGAVDASPELALALLGLFAAELGLRVGSEARRRRRAARALG
jgi:von Willebrand factor type A domain/Aerotolerance regulator N-terminal